MDFRKHISCVHMCVYMCACPLCMCCAYLQRGSKKNTAPSLTCSQRLEKGKQILVPHLKPVDQECRGVHCLKWTYSVYLAWNAGLNNWSCHECSQNLIQCTLNGRPGEHKQKKIIHGKHVEELNIPHRTTAKYCLMYTIKITCFYKPQYVLPKWNADKSRKDEKKKLHLLRPSAFEGTSVCA